MNTRQERYQLGCLLTWSLLVTQTQGKKIVLQVKSCSSPNESEFVALPVFPAYPYYLTGVRLWHVHWSNANFLPSIWHFLSLSPILTQRNCKRNVFSLPGSNTQGNCLTHMRAVLRNNWGKETLRNHIKNGNLWKKSMLFQFAFSNDLWPSNLHLSFWV